MCKISVILPSLNVKKYIDECLESVERQTLKEIEIICVDAGSTDGSLDIIERHARKDSRIRIINSQKKSYGFQMNLGIEAAHGRYIGIVETDDVILPEMFETLYITAEREKAEIVKSDFYRFAVEGDLVRREYTALDPSESFYLRIVNPGEETGIFRCVMNTWSGIYLRSFLTENGIRHNETPGASFQDNGFWFQTFCCATRIYFLDEPFYMNRRDNSHSSVASTGKVYCMTEEWHFIYDWLCSDRKRFERFIGPYTLRMYHSLLFTYNRIAPEYREAFIRHMSEELRSRFDAGEYVKEEFISFEWKRINQIQTAPEIYHEVHSNGCWYLFALKLVKRLNGFSPAVKVIKKVDGSINSLELIQSWVRFEGIVKAVKRVVRKNMRDTIDVSSLPVRLTEKQQNEYVRIVE